ncbi:hypothetical protein HYU14_00820 [Candidatus Woesearchaeota archaeon]|nr:hypothetical protein [Candidatus Woesearchaeota archaeon]
MQKNKITKERFNFTIDAELFGEFRNYCKEHCINMSAKMESYIRKELGMGSGKGGVK